MNKTYTLKELAEIYMGSPMPESACTNTVRAGIQKVLDSIGYEFPKDEEREAFERWLAEQGDGFHPCGDVDKAFAVWKAGRKELRRAQLLDKQPAEPAWIPWEGGKCPLADTVKRWEYRARDQFVCDDPLKPSKYDWKHYGLALDIVAYRVWEE